MNKFFETLKILKRAYGGKVVLISGIKDMKLGVLENKKMAPYGETKEKS